MTESVNEADRARVEELLGRPPAGRPARPPPAGTGAGAGTGTGTGTGTGVHLREGATACSSSAQQSGISNDSRSS